MMTVYSGQLASGRHVELTVEGGRITDVRAADATTDAPWLLPVLVDLQHNGSLGVTFNELHAAEPEALSRIATHLRRHGVGRCLATTTTYPEDDLVRTAGQLRTWLDHDADLDALFCGLFHEGIFISPEDGWRGAHVRDWVRPPDLDHFQRFNAASGDRVRIVNVAPEQPGAMAFIDGVVAAGARVTLGHGNPDAQTVAAAVDHGATLVTHFGNGAPPSIHRHRNPLWSYLAHPQLHVGLICDGFHLPPDLVRAALQAKGRDGCYIVSDASGYGGMPPGTYTHTGWGEFAVSPDGYIHVVDSEMLSGAWFQLDRGVEFLVRHVGLDFLTAWELCSRTPARIAGIELPDLTPHSEASFVLAHWDDGLVLDQCVHRGHPYLTHPLRPHMV